MGRRVLLVGCGSVGAVVAGRLRLAGDHVTGTTTRPERLPAVALACDTATVVRGSDADSLNALMDGVDAVVVCVSPPESGSVSVEGRRSTYREALVGTATSLASAPPGPVVLAISSLSVLGTAEHNAWVDETTPLPDLDDPSPVAYREMEATLLAGLPGRATILRTGDIVGPDDPGLEAKVRFAHERLGGSVPFDDRALAYRVTSDEVADVAIAVLEAGPQGVVHVVPARVPLTNGELYGRACRSAGLATLTFRRELLTPVVEVRATRLHELGLTLRGVGSG